MVAVRATQTESIRLWSDMKRYYVDGELLNDRRHARWRVRIPADAMICRADGSPHQPAQRRNLRSTVFGLNTIVTEADDPSDTSRFRYTWLQYQSLDRADPEQETYILERSVRG